MGSQAEPWNQVRHKNCMREKYENYNKVNSLGDRRVNDGLVGNGDLWRLMIVVGG